MANFKPRNGYVIADLFVYTPGLPPNLRRANGAFWSPLIGARTLPKINQLPQRPSRKHLEESVRHLEWLETLGGEGTALQSVTPTLVGEFAKQARTADAGEFKDFTGPKRYALLLSLIHNARTRTRDLVATDVLQIAWAKQAEPSLFLFKPAVHAGASDVTLRRTC